MTPASILVLVCFVVVIAFFVSLLAGTWEKEGRQRLELGRYYFQYFVDHRINIEE